MAEEPDFFEIQRQFTRFLRDPAATPPPGIEARRLGIYAYAAYSAAEGFLSDNFPLVRACFGDAEWEGIVRRYMQQHVIREHEFSRIPLEFLAFVEAGGLGPDVPPYLAELADFEWMETKLSIDRRVVSAEGLSNDGDLATGTPVLNPVSELKCYEYPVHRVLGDGHEVLANAQQSLVVVFRNLKNRADFVELNPVAARLYLALLEGPEASGVEIIHGVADDVGLTDRDGAVRGGLDILARWRARDLLLGTRPQG